MASTQRATQEPNFDVSSEKIAKNSCKTFHKKPNLIDFVNLSTSQDFSCARKRTVDIDILVASKNLDREIMQSIRITSRPSLRIMK